MWPLLCTSLVTLTVVIERFIFLLFRAGKRDPECLAKVIAAVEAEEVDRAIGLGENSSDYVVRTLVEGLKHREDSFSAAILRAANMELKQFNRGIAILDTIITLAPLLGLLGTVTGMIRAFGLVGGELDAPVAITGGVAEALIATAFGLGIAITALIPFNYLNARLEEARHDIENAATQLELICAKRVPALLDQREDR
jgi:biopolymer transport protein ExbB